MLLGVLIALPTLARDFEYTYAGQTITYTVLDEEAKTCKTKFGWYEPGNSVIGNLILPSTVSDGNNEYTLTNISEFSFYKCSGLTSITLPNSVSYIGLCAFSGCTGLTSVIIPKSATYVDASAFYGCNGLKKVAYPNTLDNPFPKGIIAIDYYPEVDIIEDGWIYSPYKSSILFAPLSLKGEFIIPSSITEIGDGAFAGCDKLTSVIIPNSIIEIGLDAFEGCIGLKKYAFPNTFESPFYNNGFGILYDPETAIIEDGWIYGPNKSSILFAPLSLKGEFVIPNSITEIGDGAFVRCDKLTSITIPNSVTNIQEYAFHECSGLTSVTIPNSVMEIGESALDSCTSLTSITIPNSVTFIGYKAFYNCPNLTSVTYLAEEPLACYSNIFSEKVYKNATLNYLQSAVYKIASTQPWRSFQHRIGHDANFNDDYSEITEILNSEDCEEAVYDMHGIKIGDSTNGLPKGIYIVKTPIKTTKIAI